MTPIFQATLQDWPDLVFVIETETVRDWYGHPLRVVEVSFTAHLQEEVTPC